MCNGDTVEKVHHTTSWAAKYIMEDLKRTIIGCEGGRKGDYWVTSPNGGISLIE